MKITANGLVFEDYNSANPAQSYSTFTTPEGVKLHIKTTTLVKMYSLVQFDLERRGVWQYVLDTLEAELATLKGLD